MTRTTRILALALAGGLAAGAASAQGWSGSSTTTGPRGNSHTTQTQVTGTPGDRSIVRNGSTSTGRSWESQATRTWDPQTGTWVRQGGGSTAGGATWSQGSTTTCAERSCTREGEFTGPRGNTSTGQAQWTHGDGVVEGQSTRSGPRGTTERQWRRIRR